MNKRSNTKEMQYNTKEQEVIELYAKKNRITLQAAEELYSQSKLRNILKDKDSTLILESPYYILDRYSEYMEPCLQYTNLYVTEAIWRTEKSAVPPIAASLFPKRKYKSIFETKKIKESATKPAGGRKYGKSLQPAAKK